MPNELITRSGKIAAEIRAEMARQNISVSALSDEIGMPISTLRRSVNGQRSLTVDELFVITRVLGLRPTELIAQAIPNDNAA